MEFWEGERCEYCAGLIVEKKTDVSRKVKGKYVLIENVPTQDIGQKKLWVVVSSLALATFYSGSSLVTRFRDVTVEHQRRVLAAMLRTQDVQNALKISIIVTIRLVSNLLGSDAVG